MKNKILYFENLRILALIAVVVIHVDRQLMVMVTKHGIDSTWWLPISIWAFCLFAVPVLVMQSGALLLNPAKEETTKDFFIKRIWKIFLPIATWTLIYTAYVFSMDHTRITHLMYLIVTDKIYHHLWYVYTLLGLYAMTPILRSYIKSAKMENIAYLLVLWFFVTTVNPTIKKLLGFEIHVELSYLYGFIGYFVLGYYLHKVNIRKNIRVVSYILGLVGIVCAVVLTYIFSQHTRTPQKQWVDLFFAEYKSFAIIFFSIGIFIWAKYSKVLNAIDLSWHGRLNIGRICFGVYLGHALVIDGLRSFFGIKVAAENPAGSIVLLSILVAGISFSFFIILDLLRKYKWVNGFSRFLY